jgi:hypothetical protein
VELYSANPCKIAKSLITTLWLPLHRLWPNMPPSKAPATRLKEPTFAVNICFLYALLDAKTIKKCADIGTNVCKNYHPDIVWRSRIDDVLRAFQYQQYIILKLHPLMSTLRPKVDRNSPPSMKIPRKTLDLTTSCMSKYASKTTFRSMPKRYVNSHDQTSKEPCKELYASNNGTCIEPD